MERVWVVASGLALGLVGFAAGFGLGEYRGSTMWMGFLETEVRGGLVMHGNALCSLRLGEQEEAIRLLETLLDNAASSLPQGRPVASLPAGSRKALGAAKVYHAAYPRANPDPDLDRVLAQVSLPDTHFCADGQCG